LHFAGILCGTRHAFDYFPTNQMKSFMPRVPTLDEGRKRSRGRTKALRKVVLDDNMENRMVANMTTHSLRRVEVHGQAHAFLI
jgi:hypothetical protein